MRLENTRTEDEHLSLHCNVELELINPGVLPLSFLLHEKVNFLVVDVPQGWVFCYLQLKSFLAGAKCTDTVLKLTISDE